MWKNTTHRLSHTYGHVNGIWCHRYLRVTLYMPFSIISQQWHGLVSICEANYMYFTHTTKGSNCMSKKVQWLPLTRGGKHIPIHPLIASSQSQTSINFSIVVPRIVPSCTQPHVFESHLHMPSTIISQSKTSYLDTDDLLWCHFVMFISFVLHLYKKRLEVHVKETYNRFG